VTSRSRSEPGGVAPRGASEDPRELVRRTLELLRIDSPTCHESEICDFLHGQLAGARGFAVERVGESLVLRPSARTRRPLVVLGGHLDTVPAPDDNRPRLEGGRIHGRGASDMKAGLALMWALADEPVQRPRYDIGMVFYDAEEGPYVQNGLGHVLDRCDWLREAALAVLLEPSDSEVHLGCMGTLHARLIFRGRAAHSARPWHGENAIHKAAPLLTRLAGMEPVRVDVGGLSFVEVVSATVAQGGCSRNVIPEDFTLNVNYRFAPTRTKSSARDFVRQLAGETELVIDETCPSGPVPEANPVLDDLITRCKVRSASKQAWTDVARFAEHGIDAVNFGPGETAQAHQPDESVAVERVLEADRIIRKLLSE
jgi:succinyl-diaminopimelate desuccinylase